MVIWPGKQSTRPPEQYKGHSTRPSKQYKAQILEWKGQGFYIINIDKTKIQDDLIFCQSSVANPTCYDSAYLSDDHMVL